MRWPWTRSPLDQPSNVVDVRDDVFAQFLALGPSISGEQVTERSVMGLSAFYRAVSLIAGQLASLPFRSYTTSPQTGRPVVVRSVFDDPDGPDGQTVFEWKQTAFAHQLLHGCAIALRVSNVGGGLARLPLVHPASVSIEDPQGDERPVGGLWFRVRLADGSTKRYDQRDVWYAPGLSLDGKRGVSLLTYARLSLATTQAGDRAAGNMFARGALIAGLATPDDEEDITGDVPEIRRQLDAATGGSDNAGRIAVVNRRLKFTPWTMTAADAQFLQSRQFQIEEISRWTGVPPHLLMQTDKQTSWGTGVEMQDRALGRTVLSPWANGFEQRASRLLASPRWCEFDFAALERPTPEIERAQIIADWNAGLITLDEARARMKLDPVGPGRGGDQFHGGAAPAAPQEGGDDDPTE